MTKIKNKTFKKTLITAAGAALILTPMLAINPLTTMAHAEASVQNVKGSITINKTDKVTGAPIANVEFTIFNNHTKQEIKKVTTNEKGSVTVSDLGKGMYGVRESKPAEGYLLEQGFRSVWILKDGDSETFNFKGGVRDVVVGHPTFKRIDLTDGSEMKHGHYKIYDSKDNFVSDLTIYSTGIGSSLKALGEGSYTIKQNALPSYESAVYNVDEDVKFKITRENPNPEVVIHTTQHKKSAKMEFTQITRDGVRMPFTEHTIFKKNTNEVVCVQKTDENGKISVELPYGDYYIMQTQSAPDYKGTGFSRDGNQYNFSIYNWAQNKVSLTGNSSWAYEVQENSITLYLTDSKTGAPIANAEFNIVTDQGFIMNSFKTDEKGIAKTNGALWPARYHFEPIYSESYHDYWDPNELETTFAEISNHVHTTVHMTANHI